MSNKNDSLGDRMKRYEGVFPQLPHTPSSGCHQAGREGVPHLHERYEKAI